MNTRVYGDFVQDILDSIDDTGNFIEGMDFEDFIKDKKTIYSVVHAIEIIGEATKNIPEQIKKKYSEVPWKKMAGMRDRLTHGYFGVDLEILWGTAKKDVPLWTKVNNPPA
ncbi:MAG TPA: DUF86 domain-containing protein [Bacteroidales bacterium]|nr:DUF86 domain-containing protein [Bacteroidales bacterium]